MYPPLLGYLCAENQQLQCRYFSSAPAPMSTYSSFLSTCILPEALHIQSAETELGIAPTPTRLLPPKPLFLLFQDLGARMSHCIVGSLSYRDPGSLHSRNCLFQSSSELCSTFYPYTPASPIVSSNWLLEVSLISIFHICQSAPSRIGFLSPMLPCF